MRSDRDRPHHDVQKEHVGFDLTSDPDVTGQYVASGSYVDGQGVNPSAVKWHTLLNGLEAARKDGYDLAVWSGPATPAGIWRVDYRSTSSPSASHVQKNFRGFVYVVRGYKSNADAPSEAQPLGPLIDPVKRMIAGGKG